VRGMGMSWEAWNQVGSVSSSLWGLGEGVKRLSNTVELGDGACIFFFFLFIGIWSPKCVIHVFLG
jgi:hypothetical protein